MSSACWLASFVFCVLKLLFFFFFSPVWGLGVEGSRV